MPTSSAAPYFTATNLSYNSLNILVLQLYGCIAHLMLLHTLHQPQQPCNSHKQQQQPQTAATATNSSNSHKQQQQPQTAATLPF
jgi:hypothetical protein